MSQRKPNLFLIGAMKSGTSFLRKLLNAHPDIFMCEPDEPSYFLDPWHLRTVYPEMWERGFWRDEERYLELFRAGGDTPILGEASTSYTKAPLAPGAPERIAAFNPEARFIYLIRDPVARAISHYWHMARHHAEHRSIAEAFKHDPQYVAYSNYAMQLEPFLKQFSGDQIVVVIHERLVSDPVRVLTELYEWLGVDAAAVDLSGVLEPENVAPEVVNMPGFWGIPRRLRQAPELRSVITHLPPGLHRTLHRLTTREIARLHVDVTEGVAFLRPRLLRQTERLAQLLGHDFPEWTTLYRERSPTPLPHPDPAPQQRLLETVTAHLPDR
jgi:hypothetical protein